LTPAARTGSIRRVAILEHSGAIMLRAIASLLALFFVTVASARTQIPPDSRLKAIAATKVIKVACRSDASPFSFLSAAKEQVGFSIDICKLVIGSVQKQLGLDRLDIAWVSVTVQSRFSAVAAGKDEVDGSRSRHLGAKV
jgi:ABC-type amino acid transport substrate-binding protein